MRIFLTCVARNEVDRYLKDFLLWHSWIFDGVFLYDDQSTDTTPQLAQELGAKVVIRSDNIPSFLEHEGQFRQAAWQAMVETLNLTDGDWICVLDCDEFLVRDDIPEKPLLTTLLFAAAITAENHNCDSVILPIPEVFDRGLNKEVYIRTDGFWGDLSQPRMCKFVPESSFMDKPMASGALPQGLVSSSKNCGLNILHLGYSRGVDKLKKYERYKDLSGHNPAHVASILTQPQLKEWPGQNPFSNFETK